MIYKKKIIKMSHGNYFRKPWENIYKSAIGAHEKHSQKSTTQGVLGKLFLKIHIFGYEGLLQIS